MVFVETFDILTLLTILFVSAAGFGSEGDETFLLIKFFSQAIHEALYALATLPFINPGDLVRVSECHGKMIREDHRRNLYGKVNGNAMGRICCELPHYLPPSLMLG